MRASGMCKEWFQGADQGVMGVAGSVCGPLLEQLLATTGYHDVACADLFRYGASYHTACCARFSSSSCVAGANMIGVLPSSGRGEPYEASGAPDPEDLRACCWERNQSLWKELLRAQEDANSEQLLSQTVADCQLGRMSAPLPIEEVDLNMILLCPRFGVSQQKADGTTKVRPVDHLSWSPSRRKDGSVNGFTAPTESWQHETVDDLARAMEAFVDLEGELPGFWKADIDSAFRRIPIHTSHRWTSGVAFKHGGQVRGLDLGFRCRRRRRYLPCCRCLSHATTPPCSAPLRQSTRGSEWVRPSLTSPALSYSSLSYDTWTTTSPLLGRACAWSIVH